MFTVVDNFLSQNYREKILKSCEILIEKYQRPNTKNHSISNYSENIHEKLDIFGDKYAYAQPFPPYVSYSLDTIPKLKKVFIKNKFWNFFLRKNCLIVKKITNVNVIPTDIRINKVSDYSPSDIELCFIEHEKFGLMDNISHIHLGNNIFYNSVYYIQNPHKKYGTILELDEEHLIHGEENRSLFFDPLIYHRAVLPPCEETIKYPRYVVVMNFKAINNQSIQSK